jgi:hypothetical protein
MAVTVIKYFEHWGEDGSPSYLIERTFTEGGRLLDTKWLVHPTGKLPTTIQGIEECRRFDSMVACFDYLYELEHKEA